MGHPCPAMLVIARNKSGQIQAVQATYLDNETAQKIDKSIVKIQKQTFGVLHGAAVSIPGEKGAPTLIAEGTETGLFFVLIMMAKILEQIGLLRMQQEG